MLKSMYVAQVRATLPASAGFFRELRPKALQSRSLPTLLAIDGPLGVI